MQGGVRQRQPLGRLGQPQDVLSHDWRMIIGLQPAKRNPDPDRRSRRRFQQPGRQAFPQRVRRRRHHHRRHRALSLAEPERADELARRRGKVAHGSRRLARTSGLRNGVLERRARPCLRGHRRHAHGHHQGPNRGSNRNPGRRRFQGAARGGRSTRRRGGARLKAFKCAANRDRQ